MSDHKEISSCHRIKEKDPGAYEDCAWAEASNSGGIIYFLDKEDLDKGSDPEIFQDEDRGLKGAWPLMRVRVRRFIDKENGDEWAIPEIRYYRRYGEAMGHTSGPYIKIVTDFMRYLQPAYTTISDEDVGNMVLVGGSYYDNAPSELLGSFFGVNPEYLKTTTDVNKKVLDPERDKEEIQDVKIQKQYDPKILEFRRKILKNPYFKISGYEHAFAKALFLNFVDDYIDVEDYYSIISNTKMSPAIKFSIVIKDGIEIPGNHRILSSSTKAIQWSFSNQKISNGYSRHYI
jgi:hypothetical protein